MAAHIGVLLDGHFYSWVMGYDQEYHPFAPGRLMTESLMQASQERGDAVYDFMMGGEQFKWWYATHGRLVSPMGGLKADARLWAKEFLAKYPKLEALRQKRAARGKTVMVKAEGEQAA